MNLHKMIRMKNLANIVNGIKLLLESFHWELICDTLL